MRILTLIALLSLAPFVHAADAPAAKLAGPLTGKLILKKDAYEIADGQKGEAFRDSLKNPRSQKPKPPAVDIVLELTNTSTEPVTVMVGSDASAIDLELAGPGAITIDSNAISTREFRMGKAAKIEPGKTLEIPLTALGSGPRGNAKYSYWTEPGQYTLKATYRWSDGTRNRPAVVESEAVKIEVK